MIAEAMHRRRVGTARERRGLVCLDLGGGRLRAVEIAEGRVTAWASRELHPGLLREGGPGEVHRLAGWVRELMAEAGIGARRARLALLDEAAVSRTVSLPPMPPRDLVRAMRYAAERHLPFPLHRASWSWDVVERSPSGERVYLVAAWVDVVARYEQMARAAGLQAEVLEPRSVAVARALGQDEVVLLEGGPGHLHLTLILEGCPALVAEASVGPTDRQRREAVERLLQQAYRHQATAATPGPTLAAPPRPSLPGRLAPLVVAGDLEAVELDLPVPAVRATELLEGRLASPAGFPAGAYVAGIGLGLRSRR
ncbi:MAG TPA: pilus assembly protein PilM [Candidatus Dormibacteraeota bacterium]|nr:pilus assembly protein PilM [Candidatus Dormibacteraeota bacterium]